MINVPQHAFYAMCLVLALLLLATVIRLTLKACNPSRDYTELRQRIQSWWVMIGILFFVLLASKNVAIVFFGFISFLALKEFLSIVPTRHADRRAVFWAYLSIPVQYYWVSMGWYGMFIIFIPVYVFLFIPIRMVLIGETRGFIASAGVLHWALMLTVFSISHIAYLLMLPDKNNLAGGMGLIIFLIFCTQFNDVAQYVWGKLFGRHKIIPKVSPNKTWEGFVGGLLTVAVFASFIAPWLTPLSWREGLVVGLIIAVAGFMGDLVISSVKRDLQIKDTGQLIPGHGGLLDRMDSLMYTAPLFFHFIYYLHY
ncbi:phosphatidate cytidylyltransferase [Gilvimarinus polysaccharolyticus]|uniref:phosphatidate cytidylyltransferase n=1 Tax=Gilvimarinus polysaccharolyticus TaxID=863921 RepID=UPI000673B75E|nr:phosphatidate cytidylyltransferase [Gilvimarinus polysaccharolyticus]